MLLSTAQYLALSEDDSTVYVALQEACAVAVFDLDTETITSIKPLQAKSWKDTNAGLDASNKDDQINMQKWPIYGMLMPDTMQIYTAADGIEYLVTANEGDDKEYIWGDEDDGGIVWTEMIRGKDIAKMVTPVRGSCASTCTCATDGVASCGGAVTTDAANCSCAAHVGAGAGVTQTDLSDQAKLGRIKIGLFDGREAAAHGKFNKIYTMGGRSFSIVSTKTWETVYDSGSLLEEKLRATLPEIFNSEAEKDKPQKEQKDGRSDDKGLEVESLELATVCGQTFAFVGAERTSTIFVFDITDPTNPFLHSHVSAAGNTTIAPETAFAVSPEPRPNLALGQLDPEMLTFDKERQLLVVSGSFSGTLGLYKVKGLPTCNATATTENVRMVVVLPYTAAEFTEALQKKFIRAVAFTTSIDTSAVKIHSITEKEVEEDSRRSDDHDHEHEKVIEVDFTAKGVSSDIAADMHAGFDLDGNTCRLNPSHGIYSLVCLILIQVLFFEVRSTWDLSFGVRSVCDA